MTGNARNNRRNDGSKVLKKMKQAFPTKSDKSSSIMGKNQQNSCVRYFSCYVNVARFLSSIF